MNPINEYYFSMNNTEFAPFLSQVLYFHCKYDKNVDDKGYKVPTEVERVSTMT
jgi:hypothetical protein